MPITKLDLTSCSGGQFAELMATVTRLGVSDATADRPNKTKMDLLLTYCLGARKAHTDALYAAYKAGRFHVDTMARAGDSIPLREGVVKKGGLNPPPTDYRPPPPQPLRPATRPPGGNLNHLQFRGPWRK
jgi:hypothetical protein